MQRTWEETEAILAESERTAFTPPVQEYEQKKEEIQSNDPWVQGARSPLDDEWSQVEILSADSGLEPAAEDVPNHLEEPTYKDQATST